MALSMEGKRSPGFQEISRLADNLAEGVQPLHGPLVVAVEQDMAKALGQALRLRLGEQAHIVCLDSIHAPEGSYLDIGSPVSHAFPVVVKTLVLGGK